MAAKFRAVTPQAPQQRLVSAWGVRNCAKRQSALHKPNADALTPT